MPDPIQAGRGFVSLRCALAVEPGAPRNETSFRCWVSLQSLPAHLRSTRPQCFDASSYGPCRFRVKQGKDRIRWGGDPEVQRGDAVARIGWYA